MQLPQSPMRFHNGPVFARRLWFLLQGQRGMTGMACMLMTFSEYSLLVDFFSGNDCA